MAAPTIEVREVTKSFGTAQVLKGVSLDILAGKINFIIGRSGEGKSVLLKILTGLYRPDSGSVNYGQLNLAKAKTREINKLRRRMGLLFQEGALFDSMTVGENVIFPLWFHNLAKPAEANKKALDILGELGMARYFNLSVALLSTGEKKRVALARALIVDPEVVFFDEPTTGLDPLLGSQVDELIVHAQKVSQATVVVVSHDMAATLSLADRVTLLRLGQVVLSGSPDQFRKSPDREVVNFLSGGELA
ncbi:MAG: ATP-binding cassette domain-containing protein [Deltaproteobacteria bacterium]|jgi:phospholipid/cholesterol/gamma-HCH transport system ATP-binding protein|nr:ATP-binding cassette domain-containing protein [Deltaproteobacteria bacterium]